METEKKKRGRPPKHKSMEFEGMTYEGAINHALDQEVRADLDKCWYYTKKVDKKKEK